MQRRLITATTALALAASSWATSLHAQALSGDPDQNRKPGVAAGKEVNGAVGTRSGDDASGTSSSAATGTGGQAAQQSVSPRSTFAAADSDGIRRTISQLTETAVKPDGMGQITQYIAGEDATRLGNVGEKNSILDQQIQTFQKNWKQRYNQDFAVKDQQLVLNDRSVQIVPGAIVGVSGNPTNQNASANPTAADAPVNSNSNPTAANAPANAQQNPTAQGVGNSNPTAGNAASANANGTAPTGVNANPTASNSQTPNPNPTAAPNNAPNASASAAATAQQNEAAPASARQAPSDAAGNNVATVMIPASHSMPQASVVLTREATPAATSAAATTPMWKVDLPDSVDTRQLQQSLARHLRTLNDAQAAWPATANEAYNMVAHTVLLALSEPGQYAPEPGNRSPNLNHSGANQQQQRQQQPNGATRSNVGGGTGSTGAATSTGRTGVGTTGAGSTGSQSTGAGPADNNTTGAGSTSSGSKNP